MIETPLTSDSDERATVIIVDDSVISLKLLERALTGLNDVQVRAFEKPEEALAAYREGPCDLLITDLQMPVMDGLQLIQACTTGERGGDAPIMVVTASTEREMRQRALTLGAIDFLTKPLDADEIRARTRNMVALARAQAETGRQVEMAG